MRYMSKFYCPKCHGLTFSLRYMKKHDWFKPKTSVQYCEYCLTIRPEKECLKGVRELKKSTGGDRV